MRRALELFVFYGRLFLMLLWLIISSIIMMPLALIRWKNPVNNYLFAKLYGKPAMAIMGIHTKLEGMENLALRPAIFVANHQSGIDLATMCSLYPVGSVVIGKKELRYIPGFGLMFEAFGNVLINRQDRTNALSGLRDAVEAMRKKNLSAFIFPEGTRNASGIGLLPFKKGAFYMAVQAQAPIVPLVCSRLERLISFEGKYARSGTLVIKALPPISTVGTTQADVETLLNRTRDAMVIALEAGNREAEAIDAGRLPKT